MRETITNDTVFWVITITLWVGVITYAYFERRK